MKKTYITPATLTLGLQTESTLLSGSIKIVNDDSKTVDAPADAWTEKKGWGSENWSEE